MNCVICNKTVSQNESNISSKLTELIYCINDDLCFISDKSKHVRCVFEQLLKEYSDQEFGQKIIESKNCVFCNNAVSDKEYVMSEQICGILYDITNSEYEYSVGRKHLICLAENMLNQLYAFYTDDSEYDIDDYLEHNSINSLETLDKLYNTFSATKLLTHIAK